MKLNITKTRLDKELKSFISEIKNTTEQNDAYRTTLYSTDGTQKFTFIFDCVKPGSKKKSFIFKF